MRAAILGTVLAGLAGAGFGYALAGRLGVVAMVSVVAGCVLVALRERHAGRVLAGRGPRRPARAEWQPADPLAGFGSLRAIRGELSSAVTPSARYASSTRRLLRRHLGAALAGHGIDLDDVPAAETAVGAELWPYVCAESSPRAATRAPSRAVLLRIIDRVESL